MTATNPGRPAVSVQDANNIAAVVDRIEQQMAAGLTEIKTLLSERDLLALWDHDTGWFQPVFEPIADHFHTLQRAHLSLIGEQENGTTHQLNPLVDEQQQERIAGLEAAMEASN